MADHMRQLAGVASTDVHQLIKKEDTYRGSWKRRGGAGAYHMLARKWDRLEVMQQAEPDLFKGCAQDLSGADGSMLAEIRDLRRYLLLVEAEVLAQYAEAVEGNRMMAEVLEGIDRIEPATFGEFRIFVGGKEVTDKELREMELPELREVYGPRLPPDPASVLEEFRARVEEDLAELMRAWEVTHGVPEDAGPVCVPAPPAPEPAPEVAAPQPLGKEALTDVSDQADVSVFIQMADQMLPKFQRSLARYEKLMKADPLMRRRWQQLRTVVTLVEALVVPEDARFF